MLISDAAKRIIRIRPKLGGNWDFGSAFWATNGTDTKLLTAAHVFKNLGYPGECPVDYWSLAYGNQMNLLTTILYANGDHDVEIASLITPNFPLDIPTDAFTIDPHCESYCAALGYPVSLNTKFASGILRAPHLGVIRGVFSPFP
jgi:hypothetical protein